MHERIGNAEKAGLVVFLVFALILILLVLVLIVVLLIVLLVIGLVVLLISHEGHLLSWLLLHIENRNIQRGAKK